MKLLPTLLIPALAACQDQAHFSEAAKKLQSKPRTGDARLTWTDGGKKDGQIIRVTDQFVTLEAKNRSSCEDVDLSRVADVRWLGTPKKDSASHFGAVVVEGAFLAPLYVVYLGYVIADPFRRISPPLRPPRGNWESVGGVGKSILVFNGSTVGGRLTTATHGRYSVARDRLHMMFDGVPESVIPLRFRCRQLILDSDTYSFFTAPHHVATPIVGEWHSHSCTLNFKPDGTFERQDDDVRNGTFETTANGVKIHWSDGQNWTADIEHRHIVVRFGSVVTKYHFVPSGLELDL